MMRSYFEAFMRDEIWALEVLVGLNEGDLRDTVMEFWEFVQSTIKPFFPFYLPIRVTIFILQFCHFVILWVFLDLF